MKAERKPMATWQKIFYFISFVFLIVAFIYLGTKNYNTPKRSLTDQESFTQEYGISSDNVFVYKSASEVLETLNTGTAIIFMAFPENKWSSSYADMLNEVALKFGVEEIYYYNFKNDRSNNNHYYENIVNQLAAYIQILDNDETNIYAPTVLFVRDGEIIGYNDETSIMHGDTSVDEYWTAEKRSQKIVDFGVYFQKYLEGVS